MFVGPGWHRVEKGQRKHTPIDNNPLVKLGTRAVIPMKLIQSPGRTSWNVLMTQSCDIDSFMTPDWGCLRSALMSDTLGSQYRRRPDAPTPENHSVQNQPPLHTWFMSTISIMAQHSQMGCQWVFTTRAFPKMWAFSYLYRLGNCPWWTVQAYSSTVMVGWLDTRHTVNLLQKKTWLSGM